MRDFYEFSIENLYLFRSKKKLIVISLIFNNLQDIIFNFRVITKDTVVKSYNIFT